MKIPKNAQKVYSGILFDAYQWEQTLFDGSKETQEGLKRRHDGVTVIATEGDRILYAEEEQATAEFPSFVTLFGGKREEGETPLETAQREFLEESGYASDDWELFREDHAFSTKIEWTVHTFIARNARAVASQKLTGGERITIRTATFSEFLDIAAQPNFRNKDIATLLFRWRLYEPEKIEEMKRRLFD